MAIRGKIPLSDAILSNDTTFKIKTDSYPSELPFSKTRTKFFPSVKLFKMGFGFSPPYKINFKIGTKFYPSNSLSKTGFRIQSVPLLKLSFKIRVSDTVRSPFKTLFQNSDEVLSVQTIFQNRVFGYSPSPFSNSFSK